MSSYGFSQSQRKPWEHRPHDGDRDDRDDWEDWEDEDVVTPIMDDDQELIMDKTAAPSPLKLNKPASTRLSQPRYSVQKLKRLKSRQRQKAQNAKAGIKVVTDMTTLQQKQTAQQNWNPDLQQPKFVDAAALRALEGSPNSASVGNWNWLKKKPDHSGKSPQSASRSPLEQDLSPNDRPIVIGIALPPDMAGREISPQTAVLQTPNDLPPGYANKQSVTSKPDTVTPLTPSQQRSVWSPDTPDTTSPFQSPHRSSSIYSQATGLGPVHIVRRRRSGVLEPSKINKDQGGSKKSGQRSYSDTWLRKGYEHVRLQTQRLRAWNFQAITDSIRHYTEARSSSIAQTISSQFKDADRQDPYTKENPITVNGQTPAISEQPPPYSPSQQQKAVRYRAVFPTGHPLQALYPPSPGPISPAINGTMSSQGGIKMIDIPLTPSIGGNGIAPSTQGRLPERLAGTFVPGEHFLGASGEGHRVERERRRHDREEITARKLGGFWRGRWCIPSSGCYGRSGREGRKRRRVCLGVCGGGLALSILVIVLCITLIPRNNNSAQVDSIFVNLTDFPPMPTGVLSVVGPDNIAAVTGCSSPSTVWSCALPKEEHDSVAPYRANQPTFIMHIQWDNDTRNLWDVPNGEPPRPGSSSQKRGSSFGGIVSRARSYIRRQDSAFSPSPTPPAFEELYFLGNTTDGIESAEKAGEPTPFYLSVLKSGNESVGSGALDRRQSSEEPSGDVSISLPAPDLEGDGTGAPAQLFPHVFQQPVRLYDRGLPTEHYGFYNYFKRTIYLKSVTTPNSTEDESNVPLDTDGGSRRSEAKFLVTWSQTRFLVQIWTRSTNSTQLLASNNGERPGTMPYPVSVKMDTHGGRSGEKFVWHWPVNDRQGIDTANPKLLPNDIGFGGAMVNPRKDRDASFGGFDGALARWRTTPFRRYTRFHGDRASTQPVVVHHRHHVGRRTLVTLAIETSCDDTCVAVLSKDPGPRGRATLHFNRKVTSDSTAYGGVYPPVALRSHDAHLAPLVAEALAALPPVEQRPRVHDEDTPGVVAGGSAPSDRHSGGVITVSGVPRQMPTFVTVTRGPGMSANLGSGLATAKGLAAAWQVPLLAVNHMQAHALTPRLVSALDRSFPAPSLSSSPPPPPPPAAAAASATTPITPEYPFLTLLVSGGHTQLVHSRSLTDHHILATTVDVAVGDALDKAARHILPPDMLASHGDVMYGALLERFAFPGSSPASAPSPQQEYDYEYTPPFRRVDEIATYTSPYSWTLTPPLAASRALSYSFVGLGSQIQNIAASKSGGAGDDEMSLDERRCLARAAMRLLFEHLASRVLIALAAEPELRDAVRTLVVSGGVASNRFLMHVLRKTLDVRGAAHTGLTAPPPALCTDNAAMIAWTGMEMYEAGWESDLSVHVQRKWSIDPASDEGGILGLGGWVRRQSSK
ncbi:tRNA N6-adenosine threonylcarbamoyltransferase, mitochondrial [Colletotrichum tanaceti]|uniref:tRNA N6-adenosine threonylcarbamoyltransferase, mitochondrial n=1 Tax=Colletotrichum tanaceti TaxID=1306861 RepID=A0A4U6XD61_9PEZI|nr:tRNA N6-adenosine threonylcarbamoyltransferase, mitochondrial [Colletotrichum tanaceti]TKW53062.1 tRNA N6-adenosine threonylcarbamoyltransferase, mitochondrial [Colletotrichum tanaceti]